MDTTAPTPAVTDQEIFQWDVRTWGRALPLWQRSIDGSKPKNALALGEREGGLSLWLALQGMQVECSDLDDHFERARETHRQHGVHHAITYARQDATAIAHADASFDVVIFKSVIGALGTKDRQARAIAEMHRVLRPGGQLLFAENLTGTRLHAFLRARFVRWQHYWRYLHPRRDMDLFAQFESVELRTTGFLHSFGRTERQRNALALLDGVVEPLVPATWRTVLYGACRKAG